MRVRKIVTSRWLLVPAALLLGVAVGAAASVVWAQRRLTSEMPLQAALSAETLARLDGGDAAAARDLLRAQLSATLQATAVNADVWGVDLGPRTRELRNVATYLAAEPAGVALHPESAAMLARFEPFDGRELSGGQCRSGICELAKSRAAGATGGR